MISRGNLTGAWEAKGTALQVYIPAALQETVQPVYTGEVQGTITFGAQNRVKANINVAASVSVIFLMYIAATAEDEVQITGAYSLPADDTLALEEGERSLRYTYTATKDSLHLVRSLTLNEALALIPGFMGELADTATKDLFTNDPIQIRMSFARSPKLVGDFDGNTIVDFADFLLFTAVFGSSEGDALYNPWMDLDGDGTIAFADFLIFVNAFGQSG